MHRDRSLNRLGHDVAIDACGLTPEDISRHVKRYSAHSSERFTSLVLRA